MQTCCQPLGTFSFSKLHIFLLFSFGLSQSRRGSWSWRLLWDILFSVSPRRWSKVKGPSSTLVNLRLSLSMGDERGHMRQLRKGKVKLILIWLMIDIEIQREIVWRYIISEISWLDRKNPGDLSKGKSSTRLIIGKIIVMHLCRNCSLKRLISSWCDDDVVMWRWGLPEISVKIGVHKTGI